MNQPVVRKLNLRPASRYRQATRMKLEPTTIFGKTIGSKASFK
jgi:hypothetical protein